jgi:hypothetical protein
MKKILFVMAMLMGVAFAGKAQETVIQNIDPNAPELTLESEVIDYGTVEYGSNGVRKFKFKNTGKAPLIITQIDKSCGCTTPEWSKDPVAPGKTGEITVKYDTNRTGSFEKTITVHSNAKTPQKVLRIKGVVKPNPNPAPSTTTPAPTK